MRPRPGNVFHDCPSGLSSSLNLNSHASSRPLNDAHCALDIDRGVPFGVAVDAEKGFLYWSDIFVIKRANLDGSGEVTAQNPIFGFIGPIALSGQTLAWLEELPATPVNLCSDAAVEPAGAVADAPRALTIGSEGVYWADNTNVCAIPVSPPVTEGEPRIRRVSGGTTVDLVTGLSSTGGVAIALADPPPLPTPTPFPVGGIARGTGLAPLPAAEERGASATPWVAATALMGIGVALSGAWFARRRLVG